MKQAPAYGHLCAVTRHGIPHAISPLREDTEIPGPHTHPSPSAAGKTLERQRACRIVKPRSLCASFHLSKP